MGLKESLESTNNDIEKLIAKSTSLEAKNRQQESDNYNLQKLLEEKDEEIIKSNELLLEAKENPDLKKQFSHLAETYEKKMNLQSEENKKQLEESFEDKLKLEAVLSEKKNQIEMLTAEIEEKDKENSMLESMINEGELNAIKLNQALAMQTEETQKTNEQYQKTQAQLEDEKKVLENEIYSQQKRFAVD